MDDDVGVLRLIQSDHPKDWTTSVFGAVWLGGLATEEGGILILVEIASVAFGFFASRTGRPSVAGEVGGVGAEGTGEAWAGVGAEAEATATFKSGKLTIGTEAGRQWELAARSATRPPLT